MTTVPLKNSSIKITRYQYIIGICKYWSLKCIRSKNNLSSTIMSNIFQENNTAYDLRNKREFKTGNVRTVLNGTETISYRGPQIWDTLPNAIKHST